MGSRENYDENNHKSCDDFGNPPQVHSYVKKLRNAYDTDLLDKDKLKNQVKKLDGNLDGEFCENNKVVWNHEWKK